MDMPPRLTVCGAGAAGLAIAADNALKGLEVTLFELPALAGKLTTAREARGIEVTADSETTAGKTGFARLAGVTSDPAEAVADADVVMITVPAMYHDVFMDAVAPHLRDGQIVLFNTGYWASLRQARRLGGSPPRRHPGRVQHHAVHLPAARRRHPHRPLQAALLRRRVPW